MITLSRLDLSAFPDSPYAAELQRDAPNLRFTPKLEAEYVLSFLIERRTLIRVACLLAAVLAVLRGAEQAVESAWNTVLVVDFGLVIAGSITLVSIAWSKAYERLYMPWACCVVPVRNTIAAFHIAQAAAHGQSEMLMILPMMVLGPFFFQGLRFRMALVCGVLTVVSFMLSAAYFGFALPAALRADAFLALGVVACAIAARHLEKWSRTSFLEGRLIAELAQHDALTGTKNRRVFDDYLNRLWQQAIEDRRTVAILLIDVDHFKAFNDRYGHQAGDQTLRRVAQTVQRFVRRPLDVLTRYGGEEFAAILYDVDSRQALDTADRIRRAVGDLAIEHRGSRTSTGVTISVGVAVVAPTDERNPRGALQLADQALYEAKVKGRNRVELMDEAEHKMLVTGVFAQLVTGASLESSVYKAGDA